jgi:Family of unknown function (DUF5719)
MTMPEPIDPTGEVFVPADDAAPEPQGPVDEEPERRGALRTAGVISGRVVLGLAAIAAIAVLVAAAILLPLPSLRATPISTVVTPVPSVQQLVCPGGLLRLASASGQGATTASTIGAPHVTGAADPGPLLASPFVVTDAGSAGGSAAPQLLTTPPLAAGSTAPLVGGAQSESVSTSEFFGLAAAQCAAPSGDIWLAGGATSVGRTTLLLLANPTQVASVVSVQVFGETGQITAPGMVGIAVAAGAQRVLSIAGFAPNVVSPVVRVQSTGGQVVATLEQTTVRGLAPGGVDFVAGTPAPALTTVLPGIVVTGTASMQALQGQSGFEDLETTLRIYLPSSTPTTASVSILAEDGSVLGKPIQADLQPGTVTDFPLDQFSDGDYTAIVTSPVPVIASVRVSTADAAAAAASGSTTAGGSDFAWITAAPLLTGSVLVPVASGMAATLHLENPTGSSETVELHALSGTDLTAVVPAHKAVSVAVAAGRTYRMSGFAKLYASVSGTGDGEVTSYPISPLQHGEGPLRVFG